MPRYIALLRGINVGGHRVTMDRLRGLFLDLGLTDVSTFLASGNVVFAADVADAHELRKVIELHLRDELGYEVPTFLRTLEELRAVAAVEVPTRDSDPPEQLSHYVLFLHEPPTESLRTGLAGVEPEGDTFHFSEAEIHWRIRGKLSESPLFGGGLDRVLGATPNTMRNMNTLRRLVAKFGAAQGAPRTAG